MPKVLTYDIENTPAIVYSWGLNKQFHNLGQLIQEPRILCIAAKWEGSKKPIFLAEWEEGGRQGMLQQIHALFNEADVLVGFNSRSFDTPWVKGELIREGFRPPSKSHEIDLYRESRQFRFVSHRLAHLAEVLTSDSKMSTGGFDLWKQAIDGDEKARRTMRRYNLQDVKVTEELYQVMKPWLKSPVPASMLDLEDRDCPRCEGEGTLIRQGYAYTTVGKFQQYQCKQCGGWSRGKSRLSGAEQRAA